MLSLPLQYSVPSGESWTSHNNFVKLIDSSRVTAEQRYRMYLPLRQIIELSKETFAENSTHPEVFQDFFSFLLPPACPKVQFQRRAK